MRAALSISDSLFHTTANCELLCAHRSMSASSQPPLPGKQIEESFSNSFSVNRFALEVSILVVGIWAYWPTLKSIFEAWNSNPDYSHGFLVLPIAASILWVRRANLPRNSSVLCWVGLPLLVVAGLLRFISGRFYLPELDSWSIPIWLGGIVLLFHGWRYFRWALPSLAFLWFAAPLPGSLEVFLSTPLQHLAAELGGWSLRLVGQPAIAEGSTILLNEHVLDIERACSGLRMFYGILALAVACVVFAGLNRWYAALVLLAAAPVAVLANVCRIAVTGLLLQNVSGEAAQKFSHDIAGFVMIPLAVVLFSLVLLLLNRAHTRIRKNPTDGLSWVVHWAIVTAIALIALFWWGHHQRGHACEELLNIAQQHESLQDWPRAAKYLQRYLQFRPRDRDALESFADVYSKTAKSRFEKQRALTLAHTAWTNNSRRSDLALYAARTAFEMGSPRRSLRICEELLNDDVPEQIRSEFTFLRADTLLTYKEYEAFEDEYLWEDLAKALEATLALSTNEIHYRVELANLWQEKSNTPGLQTRITQSREIMDSLVADHEGNPMAWLARYHFLSSYVLPTDESTEDLSRQDLQRALDLAELANPADRADIFLAAASKAEQSSELSVAERYYRLAIEATPDASRPYVLLAELIRASGDSKARQAAIEVLQNGLQVVGQEEVDLLLPLSSLQVESGQCDAADRSIAPVVAMIPTLSGRYRSALSLGAGLVRAQILWHDYGAFSAIHPLDSIVNDEEVRVHRQLYPQLFSRAHLLLAKLYTAVDIHDRASEQYRFALQIDPTNSVTRREALTASLQAGDLESAELHCRKMLREDSTSHEALLSMIRIQVRRQVRQPLEFRDWSETERAYQKALQQGVPRAELLFPEVEMLYARGDFETAERLLTLAVDEVPGSPQLWRELAVLYDHQGHTDSALEAAKRNLDLAPDKVDSFFLTATLLEKANRSQEAKDLLDGLLQKSFGRRWVIVAQELARLQLLLGNVEEAKQLLLAVHEREPANLTVISVLANMAWGAADWASLQEYENWLHEVEGETGTLWRFHRAQRLLDIASSSEDLNFLEVQRLSQILRELRPRWSKTSLLQGDIALRTGQVDAAIASFQRAWNLGDRSASLADRLIELLTLQERFLEAESYVSQVSSALPLSSRLFERAIPYYMQAGGASGGDPAKALELAEAWVVRQPNDPNAHLRLGRVLLMLSSSGDENQKKYLNRVQESFRQALILAPEDVDVWLANVVFEQRHGENRSLESILDDLSQWAENNEYARTFVLAQLYEKLNRPLDAQEFYRRAISLAAAQEGVPATLETLGQASQFNVERIPALAKLYARSALALDPEAKLPRQILLQLLADSGESEARVEGLSLLESDSDSVLGRQIDSQRRAAASFLHKQGPSEVAIAIGLLETLLKQTAEDRLLLASLYEKQGRIGPAFELLTQLARSKTSSVKEQVAFLQFWQHHFLKPSTEANQPKFLALANSVYSQLQQAPRQQPEWLHLKIQELSLEGEPSTTVWSEVRPLVIELLQVNQDLASWSEAAKSVWCRSLLAVFIEAGMPQCAIGFVSDPPAGMSEADVAVAFCHAMIIDPASRESMQGVNDYLQDLMNQNNQSAELAIAVGDYFYMSGQYEISSAAYRLALIIDPSRKVAKNNLALSLAELPGKISEAKSLVQEAMAETGFDKALLDTQAVLELIDGRPRDAMKSLDRVLVASPDNAVSRIHAAMACRALRDDQRMRASIVEALTIGIDQALLSPRDRAFMAEFSIPDVVRKSAEMVHIPAISGNAPSPVVLSN